MNKYKELLDKFRPLNEEQQKDLLFLLLDCMEFYANRQEASKDDEDMAQYYYNMFETYRFIADTLLEDPEWMKEINVSSKNFTLALAHKDRILYELKRKKGEA